MKTNKADSYEPFWTKSVVLRPISPFRLDLTVWTLRRRPDNLIDRWNGETYCRAVIIEGKSAEMAVTQVGEIEKPSLKVTITSRESLPNAKEVARALMEKMLGLNVDLSQFYHFAKGNPELEPLMELFRGVKPPRFPSVFEALVNGISCQQLTLALGIRLLNRLTSAYGQKMKLPAGELVSVFPRPFDLAPLKPENFRALGYSRQKGKALIELSNRVIDGKVNLEELESMNDQTTFEKLNELRGVGRWTSEYVMLRGLGRIHVFPADDVGGRRSLQGWLKMESSLNYDETNRVLSTWKPYGGLLYFHLLLDRLRKEGVIDG
jgi:DNA-3-methyladenine glycosylase II